LDAGVSTLPFRSSANTICAIAEGAGETRAGDAIFAWGPKDIFTLPQGNWITHRTGAKTARIFMYSDREVYARLGLLKEEFGNAAP
jgi:gentisate 1,2-dioxygenase